MHFLLTAPRYTQSASVYSLDEMTDWRFSPSDRTKFVLPMRPVFRSQRLPSVPSEIIVFIGKTSISEDLLGIKKKMVRSSGFEPPRYCYRQPLKLVRLPVPPRPRKIEYNP